MEMSSKTQKIPSIRFKGFTDAWEQRKLGEITSYKNGGSFENDVIDQGKYELVTLKSVDVEGHLIVSGKYINTEVENLKSGTIVMILSEQAPGLLGKTAVIPCDDYYVLNQRVAALMPQKSTESFFLSKAINRNGKYFSMRGAGTKVQNISKPNVENFQIFVPNFDEQSKIGTFFKQVDEAIALHQRQLANCKELKKGMIQKIFNQELRFKDENGDDFSDWNEELLKDITEIYQPKALGQDQFIDAGYPVFGANGQIGYYYEYNHHNKQIAIACRGNTCGTINLIPPKSWITGNAMVVNLEKSKIELDFYYLYYAICTIDFKNIISGSGQPQITRESMNKIRIPVPCVNEQKKIAGFLTVLDRKIEKVAQKIESMNEQKKGFMQQMFVG